MCTRLYVACTGIERAKAKKQPQRDEAWSVFPYPCIGGFRFLDLYVPKTVILSLLTLRLCFL